MKNIVNMNKLPNLVFIGGSMAGKTTIVNYLDTGRFGSQLSATVGAALITYANPDYNLTIRIWDTAGQEKYDCLTPSYIRNGNVFAIALDISVYDKNGDIEIIREAVKKYFQKYIRLIIQNLTHDFRVIVILNKCDLVDALQYDDIIMDVNNIIREVLLNEYMDMDEDSEAFFKNNFNSIQCVMLSSLYGIGFSAFNNYLSTFVKQVSIEKDTSTTNFMKFREENKSCMC